MRTDLVAQVEPAATDSKPRLIRRVGVTGAAGKVGFFVVQELTAYRYDVVGVDRRLPSRPLPAVFREADLLNDRMLSAALGDCDAIVHLATPNANARTTTAQQLEEGVRLTSNVLAQAERGGMSRVVLASSEVAVGYSLGPSPFSFDYLPVDEAHPLRPSDHYGISKQLCERLAEEMALRAGIPIVAIRPAWVLALDYITRREWARRFHLPPGAHPFNFWSYVDARDTARAFASPSRRRSPVPSPSSSPRLTPVTTYRRSISSAFLSQRPATRRDPPRRPTMHPLHRARRAPARLEGDAHMDGSAERQDRRPGETSNDEVARSQRIA
jgi:NAD(P)-dependent dehydrogenase (short-subunit alcohol dehydrogenase family)